MTRRDASAGPGADPVAEELAATRAALAEVLADLTGYEPGNPWRLDSVRNGSALLTGNPFGFAGAEVLKARAKAGTTGGRFNLDLAGPWARPARLARDLSDANANARRWRELADKAAEGLAEAEARLRDAGPGDAVAVALAVAEARGERDRRAATLAGYTAEAERLAALLAGAVAEAEAADPINPNRKES